MRSILQSRHVPFGEHIKDNDGYAIEVCREVNSSLLRELSALNTSYLLRGRIQSRHMSRKTYFVYIFLLIALAEVGKQY